MLLSYYLYVPVFTFFRISFTTKSTRNAKKKLVIDFLLIFAGIYITYNRKQTNVFSSIQVTKPSGLKHNTITVS